MQSKELLFVNKTSVGERYVTVALADRISFNNAPISPEVAQRFLELVGAGNVCIEFSARKTRCRWGTAYKKKGRIVLYRHSVWMLLHELAHIQAPAGAKHSRVFARVLDGLFAKWQQATGAAGAKGGL